MDRSTPGDPTWDTADHIPACGWSEENSGGDTQTTGNKRWSAGVRRALRGVEAG